MAVAFSRTTRALAADRGRGGVLGLTILIALFAAWLAWFFLGSVTVYEISRSAHVEVTSSSRDIAIADGGRLVATGLYPGRHVKAGEVLAELDSDLQKARLAEAEARLGGYPARIAAVEAQRGAASSAGAGAAAIAGADGRAAASHARENEADASYRRDYAGRLKADVETGGSAQADAARAEAEARSASARRDASLAEAGRARGAAQLSRAEHAGDAARASETAASLRSDQAATLALVERLRIELAERQVRAPADGVIGDVSALQIGQVLAPGARLATLVPAGSLHIVAAFDQARGLGRLAEGQHARLLLDGFSWTQYGDVPARIERVAAEGRDNQLKVELAMPASANDDMPLRHGMTGQVEVAIEQVSPAVLVLRAIGRAV